MDEKAETVEKRRGGAIAEGEAKPRPLSMDDFVKGAVFYVSEPVRIARVVGHKTIEVQTRKGVERQKVAVVDVTVPSGELPGLTDKDEKGGESFILPRLQELGCAAWQEFWGERKVHPLARDNQRNIWVRDENQWVFETAVLDEMGRPPRLQRSSGTKGKALVGCRIDPSHWGRQ